jgi:hypothetical protein
MCGVVCFFFDSAPTQSARYQTNPMTRGSCKNMVAASPPPQSPLTPFYSILNFVKKNTKLFYEFSIFCVVISRIFELARNACLHAKHTSRIFRMLGGKLFERRL